MLNQKKEKKRKAHVKFYFFQCKHFSFAIINQKNKKKKKKKKEKKRKIACFIIKNRKKNSNDSFDYFY